MSIAEVQEVMGVRKIYLISHYLLCRRHDVLTFMMIAINGFPNVNDVMEYNVRKSDTKWVS